MTVSVMIVDDHPLARAGAAMLLGAEPGLTVVGEAADGESAISAAAALRPDVLLMDLRMPGIGGVAAIRAVTGGQQQRHTVRVLAMTTFDDDEMVFAALRAGASGYLLKHASSIELVDAVRQVAAGGAWLDASVASRVLERLRAPVAEVLDVTALLTAREQQIYRLVALGLSNTEIRTLLTLSEATVKTHVSRILLKTGSRDRAGAVALAYRCGFVRPDETSPETGDPPAYA